MVIHCFHFKQNILCFSVLNSKAIRQATYLFNLSDCSCMLGLFNSVATIQFIFHKNKNIFNNFKIKLLFILFSPQFIAIWRDVSPGKKLFDCNKEGRKHWVVGYIFTQSFIKTIEYSFGITNLSMNILTYKRGNFVYYI